MADIINNNRFSIWNIDVCRCCESANRNAGTDSISTQVGLFKMKNGIFYVDFCDSFFDCAFSLELLRRKISLAEKPTKTQCRIYVFVFIFSFFWFCIWSLTQVRWLSLMLPPTHAHPRTPTRTHTRTHTHTHASNNNLSRLAALKQIPVFPRTKLISLHGTDLNARPTTNWHLARVSSKNQFRSQFSCLLFIWIFQIAAFVFIGCSVFHQEPEMEKITIEIIEKYFHLNLFIFAAKKIRRSSPSACKHTHREREIDRQTERHTDADNAFDRKQIGNYEICYNFVFNLTVDDFH